MAWLEQKPSGNFHIGFRYRGQRFKKSLKTTSQKAAHARLIRLEENIGLVESGRLVIPDDADLVLFLLSDGQVNGKPKRRSSIRTLNHLCDAFIASLPEGSLEESTVAGMNVHIRHLKRIMGGKLSLHEMQLGELQDNVDVRSNEKGRRGRAVSPATIKKELTTLRLMWNWARNASHFDRVLPQKGIRYPKSEDKPRFQTWKEIEQKITCGGLSDAAQADLWDCLFLTLPEIDELLKCVQRTAAHSFIYPMFVFAAHTRARRSEMMRSRIEDIDFYNAMVTIREKKRVRGKLTTRTVPLSPLLSTVLEAWIAKHPGGQHTFCLEREVVRSKKVRNQFAALTCDEAHDHFKRTLQGGKWNQVRGWHVFRHSFCSNCAAKGIDQRVINAWVGHQTEEMVRRLLAG